MSDLQPQKKAKKPAAQTGASAAAVKAAKSAPKGKAKKQLRKRRRRQMRIALALAALIAGKPFRAAIDLHTGYTPAYSLEFYDADGVAARLLIQSFGNGRLRLDGTDWEYDFEGEDGEYLLSTLEKHHGGDRLLEAA